MATKKKAVAKKKANPLFHKMPDGKMMFGKSHGSAKKKK
jgi:hypothetical protein